MKFAADQPDLTVAILGANELLARFESKGADTASVLSSQFSEIDGDEDP
jgi:hypothetical protein